MAQVPLNTADIPSWTDFITQFDATYGTFYDNYDGLMAIGPYIQDKHPELLAQYNDLLQRASVTADKLEQLKATRDYVASWLQWLQSGAGSIENFIGSNATAAYNYLKSSLGLSGYEGLGQVAQVAYVVIGASAAIAAVYEIRQMIVELYNAAQRYNALQDAEAQGYTPEQAAQAVNAALGPPTSPASTNFLGIPFGLLVWGAIAIFLGPPIIKAITDGRR